MKKFILSTVIIAFAISCLITSCSQDEDWGMDEYSTLAKNRATRSPEGNIQPVRDEKYYLEGSYTHDISIDNPKCTIHIHISWPEGYESYVIRYKSVETEIEGTQIDTIRSTITTNILTHLDMFYINWSALIFKTDSTHVLRSSISYTDHCLQIVTPDSSKIY